MASKKDPSHSQVGERQDGLVSCQINQSKSGIVLHVPYFQA